MAERIGRLAARARLALGMPLSVLLGQAWLPRRCASQCRRFDVDSHKARAGGGSLQTRFARLGVGWAGASSSNTQWPQLPAQADVA
jgi:hypothetical protein